VVDVADGYARNYLLPRRKAISASEGMLAQAESIRAARLEQEQRAKENAEAIATQLVGTRVVIAAKAGDEGQLYGSVPLGDIVEGIQRFTGIELEPHHVVLGDQIRAIGLHEIGISLHSEVEFPLTLDIIPA
jgi:large subunit ribosomal protein L9